MAHLDHLSVDEARGLAEELVHYVELVRVQLLRYRTGVLHHGQQRPTATRVLLTKNGCDVNMTIS